MRLTTSLNFIKMKTYNCIYTYGKYDIEVDIRILAGSAMAARLYCYNKGAKKILKCEETNKE